LELDVSSESKGDMEVNFGRVDSATSSAPHFRYWL